MKAVVHLLDEAQLTHGTLSTGMQLHAGSSHGVDALFGVQEAGAVHLGIDGQNVSLIVVQRHNDVVHNILRQISIAGDEANICLLYTSDAADE